MEIPDTLNNFLKPLLFTQPVDEKELPANLSRQFSSIVSHYQNKRGNSLLFAGGSAPENAFAASLLGKHVARDVYRIDLSAAASSHLGETEKNLLQVFEFSEQHSFILLIDEADSLFSKRSNIRSDDERYANLEISYLLKRIAAYPGLVIITTNARDDLDDTLLRAVPWQIDLSHPVARRRLPLWQRFFNRFRKQKL